MQKAKAATGGGDAGDYSAKTMPPISYYSMVYSYL